MFKNWLFSAVVIATSVVTGSCGPAVKHKTTTTITPFTAQYVNIDTTTAFSDVVSRLDLAVNRTGSVNFATRFNSGTSKAEMQQLLSDVLGNNSFLFFGETPHKKWLDVWDTSVVHPGASVYTLGNPGLAAGILELDLSAGLDIPPRFMILEKADKSGTNILYQLPSSVWAPFDHNPQLRSQLTDLDAKFRAMFEQITSY